MYRALQFSPVGDQALVAEFSDKVEKSANQWIRQVIVYMEKNKEKGIIELVPTYSSLLVLYDPMVLSYYECCQLVEVASHTGVGSAGSGAVRIIEIPTVYGGAFGPDMQTVMAHTGLSEQDVIKIHSKTDYLVYMLGFIPGFTYLGGMDERLNTPRLTSPRTTIPAGSVGIAGSQTGMYPSDSPGGWQLIGRTPLKLYNDKKEPPTIINAGDYVRYVSIDEQQYKQISAAVADNTYVVRVIEGTEVDLRE